jgi:endonuclease/exonuclease/phosphatase family metal-dependent hydrolase
MEAKKGESAVKKRITIIGVLLFILVPGGSSLAQEDQIRVMSYNIRYGLADDGDDSWGQRLPYVWNPVHEFKPHILGLQECLNFQAVNAVFELRKMGLDGFVGAGRDDGIPFQPEDYRKGKAGQGGEMCAIIFDTSRFTLLDWGHFWLSPEPEKVASRGWDAALTRMATWARLQTTGPDSLTFVFCNTHFDHVGRQARRESALVIMKQLAPIAGDLPVILLGDFNSPADAGQPGPYAEFMRAGWRDCFTGPCGSEGTFNGFQGATDGPRIDWILVSPGWAIESGQIMRTNIQGKYPSDHFPVNATLSWAGVK